MSKPRRRRTATESLLSIVLIMDAVLLFFVTLTAFGLKVVDPVTAFVGGGIFIVVLALASRVQRFAWGVWLGWVLQAAILALGFLLPIMFLVGAGFVALWVYCFIRARELDRLYDRAAAAAAAEDPAHSEGDTP